MDPEHGDLKKLQADLVDLIKLVSNEMLQISKAATATAFPSTRVPGPSTSTSKSSFSKTKHKMNSAEARRPVQLKHVAGRDTPQPRLPDFFYEKWTLPKPELSQEPFNPQLSLQMEEKASIGDNKNDTTKQEQQPENSHSREKQDEKVEKLRKVTPEEKRYYKLRKKFYKKRSKRIKAFLRLHLVDGVISLPSVNLS